MKTQKSRSVGDDINELVDLAAKLERENTQLNVQLEEKIEKNQRDSKRK